MKKGFSIDGSLIKKLRRKKKWTQKELGSTVMKKNGLKEISFRTIQRLETEVGYGCSQAIINALAKVFGLETKDLLIPISNIQTPEKKALPSPPPEKLLKSLSRVKTTDDIPIDEDIGVWQGTVEQLGSKWKEYFGYFLNEYETLKFELEEEQIRYIENKLPYKKNRFLRDLKFQPMVFKTIIRRTKGTINKGDFELFCKAFYNYHSKGSEYRLKVMPGFSKGMRAYSLDSIATGFNLDEFALFDLIEKPRKEIFLESLENAHGYSIEYDLPEEDEQDIMEEMIKFIEMIEKYFNSNLSQSEELRFKFELSKVLKSFQDSPFKILYNDYGHEDTEFKSDFSNLRILIKKISNRNFIRKYEFLDKDYSEFSSTFKRHKFRAPLEDTFKNSTNEDYNFLTKREDKMSIPKELEINELEYDSVAATKHADELLKEFKEHFADFKKLKPEVKVHSEIFGGWAIQKIANLQLIAFNYDESIRKLQKQIQLLDSKI